MLAYVFWHQRKSKVAREEYQQKLLAYHQILQQQQPQGFLFSFVLVSPSVPWMAERSEVYEDWYVVKNSAALDSLDEAAVTGICREPHNQVARLADNGTGGLYRLKGATIDPTQLTNLRSATWFNKPTGMLYNELYEILHESRNKHKQQPDILWQRQMTMGPAPEFCLHASDGYVLPAELKSVQLAAQPIFYM